MAKNIKTARANRVEKGKATLQARQDAERELRCDIAAEGFDAEKNIIRLQAEFEKQVNARKNAAKAERQDARRAARKELKAEKAFQDFAQGKKISAEAEKSVDVAALNARMHLDTGSARASRMQSAILSAEEQFLKENAELFGVEVVENRPVTLKVVELVYAPISNCLGDFAGFKEAAPGTVGASLSRDVKARETTVTKHCTAQYVKGLSDAVVVLRLPGYRLDGKPVQDEEREQMLYSWLSENKRTAFWTQSSIKPAGTDKAAVLYTLPTSVADVLCAGLTIAEAANYLPLMFSDTDSRQGFVVKTTVSKPIDGRGGNTPVSPVFAPRNCQFRAIEIAGKGKVVCKDGEWSVKGKLIIKAVAKGTMFPVASAAAPNFDLEQVKFGGEGEHTFIVLRNNSVEADRSTKPAWASAMLGNNIAWTPETEERSVKAVKEATKQLFDLLKPENVAKLATRWGGLVFEDGELQSSKNAAIEMLLANVPYSTEMAEVLGRVCVKEITDGIIPSLGIQARNSLMCQSTAYGATCQPNGTVVYYRQPAVIPDNFITLGKDAFKSNQGMLVSPEVAAMGKGDSDGDYGYQITGLDAKFVAANLLTGIPAVEYASKTKLNGAYSSRQMYLLACRLISQSGFVGQATANYWRYVQAINLADRAGNTEEAAKLRQTAAEYAFAAITAPMLAKFDIQVSGQPFATWFGRLQANKSLGKDVKLAWRDAQAKSWEWKSPRDMATAHIEAPQSLIDVCWNAACDVAAEWVKANPQAEYSPTELGIIAAERMGGAIPLSAMAEAREVANKWNSHWNTAPEERGGKVADKAMRDTVTEWFRTTTTVNVAAALSLKSAKWGFKKLAAKSGRLVEVLGLRPELAQLVEERWPDIAARASFQKLAH